MDILVSEIAVAEKVFRSVVVYGSLLVAFRLAGKRLLGQLTAVDLVVLLILSNVLQNAAIGSDNSLGGGLLGAAIIIVLNFLVAWLTFRRKRLERLIESSPTVIVKHGRVIRANLEEDGHVSVIPRRSVPA